MNYLGGLCGGEVKPLHWQQGRVYDFFDAKGFLVGLLDMLRIRNYQFVSCNYPFFKEGYSTQVAIDNKVIGCLGLLNTHSIERDYFYFEVNLDEAIRLVPQTIFMPLPRYPVASRDLSFLVENRVSSSVLYNLVKKAAGPLVESLEVFDYFVGGNLPAGKKNLGFRLVFRSEERTLKDEEVDRIISHIEKVVLEKLGATLRKA